MLLIYHKLVTGARIGPSKPSFRNRLMKSEISPLTRLQLLIRRSSIQINFCDYRQRMTNSDRPESNLQELSAALLHNHAMSSQKPLHLCTRNPPAKCTIFKFIIDSLRHKLIHIICQYISNFHYIYCLASVL